MSRRWGATCVLTWRSCIVRSLTIVDVLLYFHRLICTSAAVWKGWGPLGGCHLLAASHRPNCWRELSQCKLSRYRLCINSESEIEIIRAFSVSLAVWFFLSLPVKSSMTALFVVRSCLSQQKNHCDTTSIQLVDSAFDDINDHSCKQMSSIDFRFQYRISTNYVVPTCIN